MATKVINPAFTDLHQSSGKWLDLQSRGLRGTAFGIYDVAIGIANFISSVGAGLLWMIGGPAMTFGAGACTQPPLFLRCNSGRSRGD